MQLGRIVFAAAILAGCSHTGSSNTAAGAVVTSAAAVSAAVASRAAGGCIAMCTSGTTCNPATGLCEPLPCRGECAANEHCEQTFSGAKCVAGGPTTVETLVKTNTPVTPQIAPAVAPRPDGSPTIVPAAQQQQNVPP